METQNVILRDIPIELWRQLKVRSYLEGRRLPTLIVEALDQYMAGKWTRTEAVAQVPAAAQAEQA